MASSVNFGTQQYFGFDPRTIPGCSLWLDAADSTTLTLSGSSVTSWRDKSVNGLVATSVGNNAAVLSGTSILFTGTHTVSSTRFTIPDTASLRLTSEFTIYMVYSATALTPTTENDRATMFLMSKFVDGGSYPGWAYRARTYNASATVFTAQFFNSSANQGDVIVTSSNVVDGTRKIIGLNQRTTTTMFTFVNGSADLTITPMAPPITSTDTIMIGARNTTNPLRNPFNGSLNEIIIHTGSLSRSQCTQLEGYLAWKWSLQANLPASHSFRSFPPAMRAFQPVDVPGGALLWLDAADVTTVTGSPVTQWRDKSGRASNATTGLGSVVAGTAINSLNTLRLGASTTLNLSNFVMPSAQTSVFYVFRGITSNPSGGSGYFIFSRTADNFMVFSGNEQFGCYQNPGASRSYVVVMGPNGERNWGNLPTTAFINAVNVISTTGISYASSNGLSLPLVATANVSNSTATATTYQISTSRSCCGDVYTYDLGELIVCDGTLSIPTAQQLEGYLAWKWGVPRSLPTTHPYYNVLPSTPLFTPLSIAGCSLWLDAADSTTLTLSGSSVTAWNDKSGNGRNATGGVSPTFVSNGIVFNGSTQYLSTTYSAVPTAESFFGVATWTGSTDRNYCIIGTSATNGRNFNVQQTGGTRIIKWDRWGVAGYAPTSGVQPGVQFLASGTFTGTSGQTALNGGALSASASFSFAGTGTTNIGTGVLGDYFTGTINEIIAYSSPLSDGLRRQVEGYLAWKWGLRANLPSTHPFVKLRP